MGMTKASLDLQIQAETQRAIATLQKNMNHLAGMVQNIDGNMRQSHVVMFQDITQLRIRVNFLMGELKNGMTDAEALGLEERFKEFAKGEAAKMDADISKAIREREEKAEAAKIAGGLGDENTPNVIQ
jgi:hypothetical protein